MSEYISSFFLLLFYAKSLYTKIIRIIAIKYSQESQSRRVWLKVIIDCYVRFS